LCEKKERIVGAHKSGGPTQSPCELLPKETAPHERIIIILQYNIPIQLSFQVIHYYIVEKKKKAAKFTSVVSIAPFCHGETLVQE